MDSSDDIEPQPATHTHRGPEVIFMFISPEGEFYTNGHAQRAKMIFLSLKAHWDVWVSMSGQSG